MPGSIRTMIRKILVTALIIGVLLHEPTFSAFMKLLVNIHIGLRIASRLLQEHLPTCIADTRNYLQIKFEEYIAPFIQKAILWTTHQMVSFVYSSPGSLCKVNEWVVAAGEGVAGSVPGEMSEELMLLWTAAREEVAGFCNAVGARTGG